MSKIKNLYHPENYHGHKRTRRYFEGWYYKVISKDEQHAFAFIPGIAMDEKGDKQAFIQVLDGIKKTADYIKFDAADFKAKKDVFDLSILKNHFTAKEINLDLENVSGGLRFKNQVPWSSSLLSPGIMGPFSFLPRMECYHGILSMDHDIEGTLNIRGERVDFNGGKGYMEKDWGRSFPSAYIWMQSNHFSEPGISLKSSVAKIPYAGTRFIGFIAGLWLKDRLIEFTTYNGTKLRKSQVSEKTVQLVYENRKFRLEIDAQRAIGTTLAAPISGFMDGRIEESMQSVLNVQLTDKKAGKIIFEDAGRNAGLEVAGKIEEIIV